MDSFDPDAELYCLVLKHRTGETITVGSLGDIHWEEGWTYYVGRASYGWTTRLRRFVDENHAKHWHVDYLVHSESSRIDTIIYFDLPAEMECSLARWFQGEPGMNTLEDGFGSSDCAEGCLAHAFATDRPPENIVSELDTSNLTPSGYVRIEAKQCLIRDT